MATVAAMFRDNDTYLASATASLSAATDVALTVSKPATSSSAKGAWICLDDFRLMFYGTGKAPADPTVAYKQTVVAKVNETYAKVLRIEARTMIHMASKHYIPAAIQYTTRLGDSINAVANTGIGANLRVQTRLLSRCCDLLAQADEALEHLKVELPEVDSMQDIPEMSRAYHDRIVPAMAALRKPIDELELLMDKALWPVPTYGDLMFEV